MTGSVSTNQILRAHPDLKKLYYSYLTLAVVSFYLSWALPVSVLIYSTQRIATTIGVSLLLFLPLILVVVVTVLWVPKFYSSILYFLGDSEIVVEKGVWWKRKSIVPYNRVTNIDVVQGPLSRRFALGKVSIETAGFSSSGSGGSAKVAEAVIVGIKNFEEIKDFVLEKIKRVRPVGVEAEAESPSIADVDVKILEELKRIRETLEARGL